MFSFSKWPFDIKFWKLIVIDLIFFQSNSFPHQTLFIFLKLFYWIGFFFSSFVFKSFSFYLKLCLSPKFLYLIFDKFYLDFFVNNDFGWKTPELLLIKIDFLFSWILLRIFVFFELIFFWLYFDVKIQKMSNAILWKFIV